MFLRLRGVCVGLYNLHYTCLLFYKVSSFFISIVSCPRCSSRQTITYISSYLFEKLLVFTMIFLQLNFILLTIIYHVSHYLTPGFSILIILIPEIQFSQWSLSCRWYFLCQHTTSLLITFFFFLFFKSPVLAAAPDKVPIIPSSIFSYLLKSFPNFYKILPIQVLRMFSICYSIYYFYPFFLNFLLVTYFINSYTVVLLWFVYLFASRYGFALFSINPQPSYYCIFFFLLFL